MIQVFKFGGASIATPERMRALLPIIGKEKSTSLVIVVSAYGKTTNALEKIVEARTQAHIKAALELTEELEKKHLNFSKKVLSERIISSCNTQLKHYFSQLKVRIEQDLSDLNFLYDQIVSFGELLSSTILTFFLRENGMATAWLDAGQLIRTNKQYKEAKVNPFMTQKQIQKKISPQLSANKIVITQGFIGGAADKSRTTLGREGSDYSGAILATMLSADSLTIWKDVEGLLNADPRQFEHTEKIPEISFREVVEMSYYGAQVIHPKTIKPLENANIPLKVKCFLQPHSSGTIISNTDKDIAYPPLIILKDNQSLIDITTKDFSFISKGNLSYLYDTFHRFGVKINMIQNAAISVVMVVDNNEEKIQPLLSDLEQDYKVLHNNHQRLLTIRHYNDSLLHEMTQRENIILTQKTRTTIQIVMSY